MNYAPQHWDIWRSGGTAPYILNFSLRQKWVDSAINQLLWIPENNLKYVLDGCWLGPKVGLGVVEETFVLLPGIKPRLPDSNLVIVLSYSNFVWRPDDPLDIHNKLTSNLYEFIVFKMLDYNLQYHVQKEALNCVAGFNIPWRHVHEPFMSHHFQAGCILPRCTNPACLHSLP